MAWVKVCDAGELDEEDAIGFDHAGHSYAVCRTDTDELFCIDGLCPEDGAQLAGGLVDGMIIECPVNGSQFELRHLHGYPVREVGGVIEADLP